MDRVNIEISSRVYDFLSNVETDMTYVRVNNLIIASISYKTMSYLRFKTFFYDYT